MRLVSFEYRWMELELGNEINHAHVHTHMVASHVAKVTPVGFEPTPFRNGALSHRLRPLGQSVSVNRMTILTWHTPLQASAPRNDRFAPKPLREI